jgi:hypothetical protein
MPTAHLSLTSRVVALSAIVIALASACRAKDDDEDPREHRKRRINAGATGNGSSGGVTLSCPFGLCSGGLSGAGGPEHVCQRMVEITSKETGTFKAPPPTKEVLEQCVTQMEKMRTDQPKQYAVMERCVDTAADMSALVTCMTQMYLDGGVP